MLGAFAKLQPRRKKKAKELNTLHSSVTISPTTITTTKTTTVAKNNTYLISPDSSITHTANTFCPSKSLDPTSRLSPTSLSSISSSMSSTSTQANTQTRPTTLKDKTNSPSLKIEPIKVSSKFDNSISSLS